METELKLLLAPEDIELLVAAPELQAAPAQTETLANKYFDTSNGALSAQGIALRLRYQAGQWLQTLKGPGEASGGLHQRQEWEMPVDGPALEWHRLPGDALPLNLDRKAVSPVFDTNFERTAWWVNLGGSRIEVALDQGTVEAVGLKAPLCELELELLQGSPAALFDLAEQLGQRVRLLPGAINKAERGFQLLNSTRSYPATPDAEDSVAIWIDTLSRQAEALPASSVALVGTLQGFARAGLLHVGLVQAVTASLAAEPSAWYQLADISRLGRWLIHLSRQSLRNQERENE